MKKNSFMEDSMHSAVVKSNLITEQVVRERLEELGLEHLIPTKGSTWTRFPKITMDRKDNVQSWYYDDFTPRGKTLHENRGNI